MTSRPSTAGRLATIALAVFALLALTQGAYTAAYLLLGETTIYIGGRSAIEHSYKHKWQSDVFQPAAKVESWLRGMEVHAVCGPPYIPTTPNFQERYE
jgi:hypothetical protein